MARLIDYDIHNGLCSGGNPVSRSRYEMFTPIAEYTDQGMYVYRDGKIYPHIRPRPIAVIEAEIRRATVPALRPEQV